MRKLLIATVLFAAAVLVGPRPAAAQQAPWCAVISMGYSDAYWDCRYASIEDCRPNVIAGNRGFCTQNPSFGGNYGYGQADVPPPRGKRPRHR